MDRRNFLKAAGVSALAAPFVETEHDLPPITKGVCILRVPVGTALLEDGSEQSWVEYANEKITPDLRNGTILVLPATTNEYGDFVWDFRIEGGDVEQVKVIRGRS